MCVDRDTRLIGPTLYTSGQANAVGLRHIPDRIHRYAENRQRPGKRDRQQIEGLSLAVREFHCLAFGLREQTPSKCVLVTS